jgi:UTP-glucose-1-phosphate uridylyltransferase
VRVRKAVLPAAGFGTRFLPATKAIPKEVMPLVDRPIIQYAVEEAVASGIEQIIIVISTGRSAIEDHFDANPNLERWLEERGDIEMLRAVRRITEVGPIAFVHQKEQLGLGHAVLMAKELVGDEPFAVILSDDVMVNPGGAPVTGQLIEQYLAHRGSVVAVHRVAPQDVSRYGMVRPVREEGRLVEIDDLIEKPAIGDRPGRARPLRPQPHDLQHAGDDAPRRRRRDPADRRHPRPDRRAAGLRLSLRGRAARRRHAPGVAEGQRGHVAPIGGCRRVPRLRARAGPARLTPPAGRRSGTGAEGRGRPWR